MSDRDRVAACVCGCPTDKHGSNGACRVCCCEAYDAPASGAPGVGGGDRVTETPYEVIVNALEQAGFTGAWEYGGEAALTSAMQTAEIVVAALTEAGVLPSEAERKVTVDDRIPIVPDERVPPGMGVLGYDKEGKLVVAINLDKTEVLRGD